MGRKLFRLLDGKDRFFLNALEEAKRQGEILQINLFTCDEVSRWPFELLAYGNRFYVPYDLHLVRWASPGENQGCIAPQARSLELLFMSGPGPDSSKERSSKNEDKVISQVKKFQGVAATIEDSGTLKGLCKQLKVKDYDVLYLSGCFDIDEEGCPYLIMDALEKKDGNRCRVYPGDLWDEALVENPPQLLFMTSFYNGVIEPCMENLAASYFGHQLTTGYQLPAVLVWNPPGRAPWVNATEISFLRELGQGLTIVEAVHRVRIDLYQRTRNRESILWALLQLYGSGIALNALVSKSVNKHPVSLVNSNIPLKNKDRQQEENSSDACIPLAPPLESHLAQAAEPLPATPSPTLNMVNEKHAPHRFVPQNGGGALGKIRQLSRIAFRDAGFVSQSPHGKEERDIRLEQDLYVVRKIETDIRDFLAGRPQDEFSLSLIFGEAGSGKTSLLWHFFHSFSQPENTSCEPWFLKSGIFYTSNSPADGESSVPDFQLTLPEMLEAAAELRQQGKRAVILLDTVDLLLHSGKHREYLLTMLYALEEYACQVIATSRPQEAGHLLAQADYKKLLGGYDEDELEKALTTHVNCFYGRAEARDMSEHKTTILNAVSNGLQIREVCLNPLTLRMLFTLYAPQDIPTEINTFELYCNYWEKRVVKDFRAGSSYASGEDLGEIAALVALTMLAEGAPELRNMVGAQLSQQKKENRIQLEKLESRRILQHSEDKTIRFFHQTFFEHCAARGLLRRYRLQIIPMLKRRIDANPNDLFVSPIMEQALLLVENEAPWLRTKGDGFLLYLLQSNHQLLKCSGLYVYIHRRETGGNLKEEVQHILSKSEYATVNHFLKLAPNMPQVDSRYRILFQELDIAWNRDSLDARDTILELLERFGSRYTHYVEDFLKRHNILDFSPNILRLGFKTIVNIMEILVSNSPPQKQHILIGKLLRVLEQKASDVLIIRIIEALQRLSAVLEATAIATRCEQAMKVLANKDDQKHSIPLGRLFYLQWKNTNTSVQKILAELPYSQGFAFKARLRGLYPILLTAGASEASLVWEHFMAETDDNKRWLWAQLVFPSMMAGYSVGHELKNKNREVNAGQPGTSPAIRFFREKVKTIFTGWSTRTTIETLAPGDIAVNTFQKVCKAVILSNAGRDILLDLVSAPALQHASPWLLVQPFGDLLALAYNAGNSGAVEAMQLLAPQPGNYPRQLIGTTCYYFSQLSIHDSSVVETAVGLYLKVDEAKLLNQFLETNGKKFHSLLLGWREKLDALARRLAVHSSERKRKSGFGLWTCMSQYLAIEPPPFEDLVNLLEKESKTHLKPPIIQLIGLKTGVPPGDAMNVLLPYVLHLDEIISGSTVVAIIGILLKSGTDLAPYAEPLLGAILEPPVLVESVRKFGLVLSELASAHNQLALELLERLLVTSSVRIKNRSKRNLLNYFRVPVRRVLHYAPKSAYDRFLQLVPELKSEMGQLIVEGVCREAFAEMAPKLDALFEHRDVPGEVKELIRRQKYHRQRTLGGKGWPELEELLSPGAKQPSSFENKKRKILFLSANQRGTGQIYSDNEQREIDHALQHSRNRHQFEFIPKTAVRQSDFRQALKEHNAQVVHFSGHGMEEGLMVLDEVGVGPAIIPTEIVSQLIKLCSEGMECFISSSCYSESQAAAIVQYVPYVIGMKEDIPDNAAIEFSKGFYGALFAGCSIEDAFQFGCQAILQVFPQLAQHLMPVLKKQPRRFGL